MPTLEFWPDYSGALLWSDGGERVSMDSLPLPSTIVERATAWVSGYNDGKLPWAPTRDDAWLAAGRQLFDDLRRELAGHGFDLRPGEDFWRSGDATEQAR